MAQQSRAQLQEQLTQTEEQLRAQIDRVYHAAQQSGATDAVLQQFHATVKCMAQKYLLLFAIVAAEKMEATQEDHDQRLKILQDQYTHDVSLLTATLDTVHSRART